MPFFQIELIAFEFALTRLVSYLIPHFCSAPPREVSPSFCLFLGVAAAISLSQFSLVNIPYLIFITAALLLLITGLVDDIWQLGVGVRFMAQVVAALLMIFYGGVVLIDFGQLVSSHVLFLGSYSVFLTVFSTIGVINESVRRIPTF